MTNLDWCFYGDEIEVFEDYKDYGGKTIARKGDIAIVSSAQQSLRDYVRVDFKNKKVSRYLPSRILKIVIKNEKSRNEYIEREKIKIEKKENFNNIKIGDIVNLKGFSYAKIPLYKAIVTRVVDGGVYVYKVNKKGERYKGNLGVEALCLYSEILTEDEVNKIINTNQKKQEKKKEGSQYQIGLFVPYTFRGWGMVEWIGIITDVKPRTIFIDYGKNPYNWHTKKEKKWFRNSVETKEKVQSLINDYGIMDTAIDRVKELGFVIDENTRIYEIVDKYPKLK